MRKKARLGKISRLSRYNVLIVKYGINSNQAVKFYKRYSNDDVFVKKAELMKKAELIKRNVMFSSKVEKKLKLKDK